MLRVFLTLIAVAVLAQALPAAPPPQAAGRYVVQVGAYAGPRAAAPLAGELTRKGFPTVIVPGNDYARVVVGPFATEADATAMLTKLQQQGYKGYIRADLTLPSVPAAARPTPRPAPAAPPAEPARPTPTPRARQTAPSPQPAPRQAAQGSYVVQVGAYAGLQSATPLTDELLQRGFPAVVVPGEDYSRVVVGPFASEEEATAALATLQQQGYQGYVRNDLPIGESNATVSQAAPPAEPPAVTEPEPQPAEPPQVAEATPPSPELPTPTTPRQLETPPTPAEPEQQAPPVLNVPGPATAPEPPPLEPEPAAPTAEPTPAEPTAAEPTPVEPTPPTVAPEPAAPAATPEQTAPEPTAAQQTPETPPTVPPETAEAAPGPVSEPQQQGLATLFPPKPEPEPRVGAGGLKLLVLAGEGAINNIKQRTARDPVVKVTDENNRPIAGAAITFALPDRGASGLFANGARSMTIMTDAQGTATATGLTPNAVAGDMPIQVSASYQGQSASAVITQSNAVAAGAGMSAATIGIIGAVVAGAAVGAALALGGGDKSSSPPGQVRPSGTASVNTGGVTIGAPSP